MKSENLLLIIYIVGFTASNFKQVISLVCPSGETSFGIKWLPDDANETLSNETLVELAYTYMLPDAGAVPCDGVIKFWTFRVVTCTDVWFQVWDNTGTLIGQNEMSEAVCLSLGTGDVTLGIPSHQRIPVLQDYYIGFSFSSAATELPIELSEFPDYLTIEGDCGDPPTLGQSCSPGAVSNYSFLLKATVTEGPPPTINNLETTIYVKENENTGMVYTVKSSHISNTIAAHMLVQPAVQLDYTLTSLTAPWSAVDNNDGTLTISTSTSLDHETTQSYELPVTVQALSQTATATMTVKVVNINDIHILANLPRTESVNVADTCQTNRIFKVSVTDEDDLSNATTKYYAIGQTTPNIPPAPFTINSTTGEVMCTAALARWTADAPQRYTLALEVYDEMFTVAGALTVDIVGAFSKPVLRNLPVTKPIMENTATTSTIFKVDGNGPDQSAISYVINDVIPHSFYFHFTIDQKSGEITLLQQLDYLLGTTVHIEIGISDNIQTGVPQNLTLDVTWVNVPPAYRDGIVVYNVTIPEECNYICNESDPATAWPIPNLLIDLVDRDVFHGIPIADPDTLHCEVMAGPSDKYFQYGPHGSCSKLSLVKRLDIDDDPLNQHIKLTIRVQDKEGKSINYGVKAHVYVTVFDLNDNAPVFDASRYDDVLEENMPSGVSVLQVRATDKDSGLNGEVRYSLEDAGSPRGTKYFEIDHITGVITSKQPLDYESTRNITFKAVAMDRGIPVRKSSVIVEINIIDLNDVDPEWGYGNPRTSCYTRRPTYDVIVDDPCFLNLESRDDHYVGFDVIKLAARDPDSTNNLITYYTLYPDKYFTVDENSAEILTASELSTYVKSILVCYAQDNGISNRISKPPLVARIDTYNPKRQLINIVMGTQLTLNTAETFIKDLYSVLLPWFPKMERLHDDNVTVTMYALVDDMTYDQRNIDKPKQFVDRNQLLGVLRKNLKGTPTDILTGPDFTTYNPILVEPAYPIWIIDTIPGVVTLALICLALVGLIVGLAVGLCHKYKKLCFKKKPQPKFEEPPRRLDKKTDPPNENQYDKVENEEQSPHPRRRSQQAQGRRMSTDTIHSIIYDPGLDFA